MAESSDRAEVLVAPTPPVTPARALARLVAFCAGVLLVMMTFIVLLGVFYRYALGDPIFWIEEVSRYAFAYIVFLGAALSTHRRGHMAVDALVMRLPHRVKDGWHVAIDMVVATVLLFVLVKGWQFTPARHDGKPVKARFSMDSRGGSLGPSVVPGTPRLIEGGIRPPATVVKVTLPAGTKSPPGEPLLRLTVDETGRVADAGVEVSCGVAALDDAALAAARQMLFAPAVDGKEPVSVYLNLPVRFVEPSDP